VGEGKVGSAEERRYAGASRALRHFLVLPSGDHPRVHVIGPIRNAARYNRAFGQVTERLDVTGFMLIVDDQHVIHASRRHGSPRTEMQRGQLPLEFDDYARLPRILGDPDTIEPGATGRRGGPSVVVTKAIGGVRYRVVIELRMRRRQLAFVSMFKARTG
jgi:hypothetical protein